MFVRCRNGHWQDSGLSAFVCVTCGAVTLGIDYQLGTDSKLSPSTKSPYKPNTEIEEE